MRTECTPEKFLFQGLGKRKVEVAFDGGAITSDAGGLLLREVEARFGIIEQFAECFKDHRNADLIEHTVFELVAQQATPLRGKQWRLDRMGWRWAMKISTTMTRCVMIRYWRRWRAKGIQPDRTECVTPTRAKHWRARAP